MSGQQKACGSTGAALLGNGPTKLRKWCKLGKEKKEENNERTKGQMGNEEKKIKGKKEQEGKKRKDEDKIFLRIIE